jgi:DDE superfamily endonuclease
MFAVRMLPEWSIWVAALSLPLHGCLAGRLATVVVGLLFASGRRTVTSWWRAAGVGSDFRSSYYFLDALGRKTAPIAAVLLGIVLERIPPGERLVFALDDTPTKRYGPKVQGAGIHHNPTPGPAGSQFLYGHSWVVLARVAHHARFGVLGLPLLGSLYVRKKDVPLLPVTAGVIFRTKLTQAVEMIGWLHRALGTPDPPVWLVIDDFYAKRAVLRETRTAQFTVVGRLRKNAALFDLPAAPKPGQKRRRGRQPIYGKNRLSLAKRAGQRRGWTTVEVRTTTGAVVKKQIKTFLATWRPAGGVIRVVIIQEEDGSWRAVFCTDPTASAEQIVQTALDRWGIEQGFKDLKEIEGIAQVQLRRYHANVGALNLNLWVHTLIEVWAWTRSAAELSDRSDRPWDDADRRPSHADRRKALQRTMLEQEYRHLNVPRHWHEKIRPLLEGIIKLAA